MEKIKGGGRAAFNVYLNGKCIDTVFWNSRCDGGAKVTADDVRRSLINHDGYDDCIVVRCVSRKG